MHTSVNVVGNEMRCKSPSQPTVLELVGCFSGCQTSALHHKGNQRRGQTKLTHSFARLDHTTEPHSLTYSLTPIDHTAELNLIIQYLS